MQTMPSEKSKNNYSAATYGLAAFAQMLLHKHRNHILCSI